VPFSAAALIGVFALVTLGGLSVPQHAVILQDVRGYSALQAGLLTIPMAAMLAVFLHRLRPVGGQPWAKAFAARVRWG